MEYIVMVMFVIVIFVPFIILSNNNKISSLSPQKHYWIDTVEAIPAVLSPN